MLKRYSEYKDSGIEWIGQVPEHWPIKRLKFVADINPSRLASVAVETDSVFIPMEAMNSDGTYDQSQRKPVAELKSGFTCFVKDDVIFAKITPCFENGKGALLDELASSVGFGSTEFHVLRKRKGITISQFLYYLSISGVFRRLGEAFMQGVAGQKRVTNNFVRDFVTGVPSVDEQEQIADFLDIKTAQIDDLLVKKERMIKLLIEERAAIINQAVTKGLNPKVEMKDSGIEWLGRIPKYWEIKKLKFNAAVQFSNVNKKSEDGESSVRLCNYVDVYYNDFITPGLEFMEATASSEEIKKFHLKVGDVLLTKDSEEWNDIAIPAYMTFEAPDLICGYHLAQVRPQEKLILGRYLFWLLSADCINYQFRIEASGVTRYGLSNYALSNSMCLIPPKKEQEAIATFLDIKTAQIDEQVNREQKSIELLKEYRTSLISEVVTGKICVYG